MAQTLQISGVMSQEVSFLIFWLFILQVFSRLKTERPEAIEKVILIKGDCEEINLGISAEDRQILIDNIDIVFHVAASVRFDDSLKKAVMMNTRGTYYTVELAKQFPKLKVCDQKNT